MINVLFILLSKAVIIDHVIKTKIKLKIKKIKKLINLVERKYLLVNKNSVIKCSLRSRIK